MERPQSILWFERLYLGAVVIGLANTALNWSRIQEQIAATPNSALLPSWFYGVTISIGIGINLLIWYFVARRGSVIAKWIVTVLTAIGLFGLVSLYSSVSMGIMSPVMAIISVVLYALQVAAVVMLFRPDTRTWFSGDKRDLGDTFS